MLIPLYILQGEIAKQAERTKRELPEYSKPLLFSDPYTEIEVPNLARPRTEREEPIEVKSIMDKQLPILVYERTDTTLPIAIKLTTLIV